MQACGSMSGQYLPGQWGPQETSLLPRKLPALAFFCSSLPVFQTPKLILCTIYFPHQESYAYLHSSILPSPCAKVISVEPPPLPSVSPPHVSHGCPSPSSFISLLGCSTASSVVSLPLILFPPHTLHLCNPQILSSLLLSLWNGMLTLHGVVS